MKRWQAVLAITVVALTAFAFARASSGSVVDCLSKDSMARNGNTFAELAAVPDAMADKLRNAAQGVAFQHGDAREVAYGMMNGGEAVLGGGRTVYVVAMHSAGEAHPLGGPVEAEPALVSTPCEIVVLDEAGKFLFSSIASYPAPNSGTAP